MTKWLEILETNLCLQPHTYTYLCTYKENITFWFWWAKVQNSYIHYFLHQDENRDIIWHMTQVSINATKPILVEKYIFIVYFHPGSCPLMLSYSHFLLLFTLMYYNKSTDWWLQTIVIIGGSKIECVVQQKKSLLTWPVSLFTHAHKAT